MHGFFMVDIKLYRRVRSIVDPDAYDKFLKEKTRQNIEIERSGRIQVKGKLPSVNKPYANFLLKTKGTEKDTMLNPLVDPRFGKMFKDKDYKIDFVSDTYLHYHPEIKYAMDKIEYQQLVADQRNYGYLQDGEAKEEEEEEEGVDDDDILVDDKGENYDENDRLRRLDVDGDDHFGHQT